MTVQASAVRALDAKARSSASCNPDGPHFFAARASAESRDLHDV
jgi:hypothetical protein